MFRLLMTVPSPAAVAMRRRQAVRSLAAAAAASGGSGGKKKRPSMAPLNLSKRPLDSNQIAGTNLSNIKSAAANKTATAAAAGAGTSMAKATSSSSSSSTTTTSYALFGAAVLVGGAGTYYYITTNTNNPKKSKDTKESPKKQEEATAAAVVAQKEKEPSSKEKKETDKAATETTTTAAAVAAGPHRVTSIAFPETMKNSADTTSTSAVVAIPEHPADGHRVRLRSTTSEASADKKKPIIIDDTTSTEDALASLKSSVTASAMEAVLASHPTSWTATSSQTATTTSRSGSSLDDLEKLSPASLRARIVQLASELGDRTKWEALRLKEFLAMKEQEVSNEYTKLMQQQRLEFENILAQRLREQETALRAQLNAALAEKDANIQTLLQSSLDAQRNEYEQEKQEFQETTRAQMEEDLKNEYAKAYHDLKRQTAADLQGKVAALEGLQAQVQELQQALHSTQSHKQGSQNAHRLSAAALQVSERLATHEPADDVLKALEKAAGPGVIATAVAALPDMVRTEGVPTVSQCQAWFEDMYEKLRQAALVPVGRPGLEGQLAARFWAAVSSAAPTSAADKDDTTEAGHEDPAKNAVNVLAKARRAVQNGNLTAALEWLEKLPPNSQVALATKDWKAAALARTQVDKAIKVIKMECALINESLAE